MPKYYCGYRDPPKGIKRGDFDYCKSKGQIRYYGLEKVDQNLLKKENILKKKIVENKLEKKDLLELHNIIKQKINENVLKLRKQQEATMGKIPKSYFETKQEQRRAPTVGIDTTKTQEIEIIQELPLKDYVKDQLINMLYELGPNEQLKKIEELKVLILNTRLKKNNPSKLNLPPVNISMVKIPKAIRLLDELYNIILQKIGGGIMPEENNFCPYCQY